MHVFLVGVWYHHVVLHDTFNTPVVVKTVVRCRKHKEQFDLGNAPSALHVTHYAQHDRNASTSKHAVTPPSPHTTQYAMITEALGNHDKYI